MLLTKQSIREAEAQIVLALLGNIHAAEAARILLLRRERDAVRHKGGGFTGDLTPGDVLGERGDCGLGGVGDRCLSARRALHITIIRGGVELDRTGPEEGGGSGGLVTGSECGH